MLKIGLLGASRIAPKAVIPQVARRDDCEVVAVACRDTLRGETYCGQYGIGKIVGSYEELCELDGIDIVYNALPPIAHADLTIRALKAGKHVLCEKPSAMNATETRAMADAAVESGMVFMEAFHYRFHPAFEKVLEIVRSGRLGEIQEMAGVFNVTIPNREGELRHDPALGGGALMDLGCYAVHACRTIAGCEARVESATAIDNGMGADLSMDASLVFENGVPARIACSMAGGIDFEASVTLAGEKGVLRLTQFVHPHKGHEIIISGEEGSSRETVAGQETYDHQLDHFIRLVRKETAPLLPPEDAVRQMELMDAIYRAAGFDR